MKTALKAKVSTASTKSTTTVKTTVMNASVKPRVVSRTTITKMINDSKGRFFTCTHIDKDGKPRTMNCQKRAGQSSELGYITVNVPAEKRNGDSGIRNINPQTIVSATIAGESLRSRK